MSTKNTAANSLLEKFLDDKFLVSQAMSRIMDATGIPNFEVTKGLFGLTSLVPPQYTGLPLAEANHLIEQNTDNFSYNAGQFIAFSYIFGNYNFDPTQTYFDGTRITWGPMQFPFLYITDNNLGVYDDTQIALLGKLTRRIFSGIKLSEDIDRHFKRGFLDAIERIGNPYIFSSNMLPKVRKIRDAIDDAVEELLDAKVTITNSLTGRSTTIGNIINAIRLVCLTNMGGDLNRYSHKETGQFIWNKFISDYNEPDIKIENVESLPDFGHDSNLNKLIYAAYEAAKFFPYSGIDNQVDLSSYNRTSLKQIHSGSKLKGYELELWKGDNVQRLFFSINNIKTGTSNNYYEIGFFDSVTALRKGRLIEPQASKIIKLYDREDRRENEIGRPVAEVEHRVSQAIYSEQREAELNLDRVPTINISPSLECILFNDEINVGIFNKYSVNGERYVPTSQFFREIGGFLAFVHNQSENVQANTDTKGNFYLIGMDGQPVLETMDYVKKFENSLKGFFLGNQFMKAYLAIVGDITGNHAPVLNPGSYFGDIISVKHPTAGESLLPIDYERASFGHRAEAIFNIFEDLRQGYAWDPTFDEIVVHQDNKHRDHVHRWNRTFLEVNYFNELKTRDYACPEDFWFEYDILSIGFHLNSAKMFEKFVECPSQADSEKIRVKDMRAAYALRSIHHYVSTNKALERLMKVNPAKLSPRNQECFTLVPALQAAYKAEFVHPKKFFASPFEKLYASMTAN